MVAKKLRDAPSERFPRRSRLLKHADFQLVYRQGKKSFSGNLTALYRERAGKDGSGPRVGFAVGKLLGGAVERNRIRRRLRAVVRRHLAELTPPVDLVLHPRKSVTQLEFRRLDAEIQQIFAAVQRSVGR